MAEVLHLQDTAPLDVAAAAARLLGELAPLGTDKKALVALADQVWVQQGMPLLPDFSAAMKTGFRAGLHDADFADHGADARRAINSSVEDSTHGRIRDLIPADFPMDDVRLVLTNAIYLHADWASPFEREQTAPATFTRADGSTVTAPTMHDDAAVDYAAGDGYRAVRLPYAGGRLAMTLLLPDAGRPLAWPATAPVFRSTAVDLALPTFRFYWDDDLSTVLQNLGMRAAFSDAADFSGVTTGATLKIAAVLHKAFVAVDEKGTEAAAATAVIAVVTGAMAPPPTSLHFDRPFLFRIDDLKTGLPLFLGSVADPTLGG
jgi:serpin B